MEIERRYFEPPELEIRAEGDQSVVAGYASVFDTLSDNLGGFREKIAKGAFDAVLGDDVRGLFNHEPSAILGRTKSGTMRLKVDARGLHYEIDLPTTTVANDLKESMKRGDITQSSFAFNVDEDKWGEDEDGRIIRTITKFKRLFDVSPVTYPAYPDASVGLRRMGEAQETSGRHTLEMKKRHLRLIEITGGQ